MQVFPHGKLGSGAEGISRGLHESAQDFVAQASVYVVRCECCRRNLMVSRQSVAAMVFEVAGAS